MSHEQVWHMIPWYVNGRAEDAQREQIEAHVRLCNECRNEVMAQRQLLNAIANDNRIDCMPGVAFQRLWERITDEDARTADHAEPVSERFAVVPSARRPRARLLTHWLAAAVVVEAIGILVLTATLRSQEGVEPPAAQFRTVTSPAPAADRGAIRAVFSPDVPMSEVQQLLQQCGLQIVGGPTEAGVYTLTSKVKADGSGIDAALAGLRASPAVRFAEPISR